EIRNTSAERIPAEITASGPARGDRDVIRSDALAVIIQRRHDVVTPLARGDGCVDVARARQAARQSYITPVTDRAFDRITRRADRATGTGRFGAGATRTSVGAAGGTR